MTGPAFTNVATGDADVDMQVGVVHGDVHYYQVAPDALPEEIFRVGVRYLNARMPAEARALIEKAVARGFETDEVRFYRLLALMSGRTLRQIGSEDLDRLHAMCSRMPRPVGAGDWTAGLRAVLGLLDSLAGVDAARVHKEVDSLAPAQRDLIVDHLGLLLEGPMEDEMWRRSVDLSRTRRTAGNRKDRVWTFFQPKPAHPRAGKVRPAAYRAWDATVGAFGLLVFLYAAARLTTVLIDRGNPTPVIAFALSVAGGLLYLRWGAEWHFRRARIRTKDQELIPRQRHHDAPPDGFARAVDRLFDRYYGRYLPEGVDRDAWIAHIAGIRQRQRDEIVEIYREQGVSAKQLAWLVRHLAGEVRQQYRQGTLLAYRQELRTPVRLKVACSATLAMSGIGFLATVATSPLSGAAWALVAGVGGFVAGRSGLRLDNERRRVDADSTERAARLQQHQKAYERWTQKLSVKPKDPEMAEWLEADRRVLVDYAMRHYRLQASQIVAYAVIEGPGAGARRARVKHGPWRYTRYQIVLFLLTKDGVRQVNAQIDFETASGQVSQRLNYRFDAVAAVRVDGLAQQRQSFELTLFNGSAISMTVTEAIGEFEIGEEPAKLAQVSLDASGLPQTLNVLEGIAAEGKEWVRHQRQRTDERLTNVSDAARKLVGDGPSGMAGPEPA